jgi:enamine deaminase RidA (YjgF/YER057c/UK114 family)
MRILSCFFVLIFLTACSISGGDPESRLNELGIELPEVSPSIANYVGVVRTGNLLFLAGHLPRDENGEVILGKLGRDLNVDEGYAAARQATIALLATLKAELGDLNRVTRVVKVFGMVNAEPDFTGHSQVINGCSDLLGDVFGEQGRHARAAAGFSSLPLGAAVEIEMIVEVRD